MSFELFTPEAQSMTRHRGPAKINLVAHPNGRTQLTMSAALRDWLQPTPGDPQARNWADKQPQMRVALLRDRAHLLLKIERMADEDTRLSLFEVRGLGSSSAYLTGVNLHQQLGMQPGHYACELVGDGHNEPRGALIDMTTQLQIAQPQRKRRSAAQSPASLAFEARHEDLAGLQELCDLARRGRDDFLAQSASGDYTPTDIDESTERWCLAEEQIERIEYAIGQVEDRIAEQEPV